MQLIRDRAVVADGFVYLDDTVAAPDDADVIVSLARYRAERAAFAARRGKLGVRVTSDTDPDELAADLDGVALVAVEFPKFTDGRGYSIAYVLRVHHGYRGELRAIGNVLPDQLILMERSGFDAFEVDRTKDASAALAAFEMQPVRYQATALERRPLYARTAR